MLGDSLFSDDSLSVSGQNVLLQDLSSCDLEDRTQAWMHRIQVCDGTHTRTDGREHEEAEDASAFVSLSRNANTVIDKNKMKIS